MKNLTLLFIILLTFEGFAQKKPDWLANRPFSNDFFIGINFAEKSDPDYIEQAKIKALKDLSSEIVINIKSETFLKTTEIDNEVKQSYENKIKTGVQKDLEGYEQVDVWQDKNQYWIYFRLSKSKYYSIKREKFENALNSSLTLFEKAKEFERNGEIVQAIENFVYSTKAIEPYLGETFDANLKTKSTELFNNSISSLNKIISGIKVIAAEKKLNFKAGQKINQNIHTNCQYTMNGKSSNIASMPLLYMNEKGTILISSNKTITDNNGTSENFVTGLGAGETSATLKVKIDLESLLSEFNDVLITQSILKKNAPFDLFVITVTNPTIYFNSDEKNLSKPIAVKLLEPALKDFLKVNGFSFAANKSAADFVIDITSDTRKGGEAYDLAVSFLDASITLTNNQNNEQIYSKQFSSIKGVKQNHIEAGNEAYRKVLNTNFKNELFPELKEKFNSQSK